MMERSTAMEESQQRLSVKLDFDRFPVDATCDGANRSPTIHIGGLKTRFFALIIDDPDAKNGPFIHWLLYNVPSADEIPENVPKRSEIDAPIKGSQGRNSANSIGFTGPCPPHGETHRYFFKVYGVDEHLNVEPGTDVRNLEAALKDKTKQYGEAIATYGR